MINIPREAPIQGIVWGDGDWIGAVLSVLGGKRERSQRNTTAVTNIDLYQLRAATWPCESAARNCVFDLSDMPPVRLPALQWPRLCKPTGVTARRSLR